MEQGMGEGSERWRSTLILSWNATIRVPVRLGPGPTRSTQQACCWSVSGVAFLLGSPQQKDGDIWSMCSFAGSTGPSPTTYRHVGSDGTFLQVF